MNTPKRHHYVPRFYLKHFTDADGFIWAYDRKTKEYRRQSIKNTAVQQNYYKVRTKNGDDAGIERLFSLIEGNAAKAIKKIKNKKTLDINERQYLAAFVSFQITRVPDYRKEINETMEKLIKMINKDRFSSVREAKEVIEQHGEKLQKKPTPEEIYEFVQKGEYGVKIPREFAAKSMLRMGNEFVPLFLSMKWEFWYAHKQSAFITTDNPFTIIPSSNHDKFRGVGLATPGANKIMPLGKDVCLFIRELGEDMFGKTVEKKSVRGVNIWSAITSDRFIYSHDKNLLRFIVERSQVDKIPLNRDRVLFG